MKNILLFFVSATFLLAWPLSVKAEEIADLTVTIEVEIVPLGLEDTLTTTLILLREHEARNLLLYVDSKLDQATLQRLRKWMRVVEKQPLNIDTKIVLLFQDRGATFHLRSKPYKNKGRAEDLLHLKDRRVIRLELH